MNPADIEKLQEEWIQFYVKIMALKSHYPQVAKALDEIQEKSAEYHGEISEFFQMFGGSP